MPSRSARLARAIPRRKRTPRLLVGSAGLLVTQQELYEHSDSESDGWRCLVDRWWQRHEGNHVTTGELGPLVSGADGREPLDLCWIGATEHASLPDVGTLRVVRFECQRQGTCLWTLRLVEGGEELRESRESLTPKARTDSAVTMQREQGVGEMATPASPAIPPEHLSDSPAAPSEQSAVQTAHFFGDTNEEPASLGRRFTRPPCPDGPMPPTAGEAARHSGDDDAGREVTR